MSTPPLLQLSRVCLTYRARPALQDIDWTLAPGEQWACLGPNGAGKTSLARVISAQVAQFSGSRDCAPQLAAEGIAYVCFEQARALCERDRKLDDSEFRADASDPGTRVRDLITGGGEPAPDFHHWVERLGVGHILDRGLRFVSTGEMRKTLLLAAILSRPGLLILDSPLDGLDRASQAEMQGILEQLLNSSLPVLLLCRSMGDVPAGVSHLLVLDRGRVLRSGLRDQVLTDPAVVGLMQAPVPALGPLPPPAPRPYALAETEPLLTLRGVEVRYGEHTILEGVNWVLHRGQHCCISGPNGCGKTTLLSLITGDNHKAYGQDITLFGVRRGSGESVWDIKQKIGLIDTQLQLRFEQRSRVVEVVISGFFDSIGLYDTWSDSQHQTARAWLNALGLGACAQERFDTLSFGLQRVVLLARAMVKSPPLLILDEPTLGLDACHRELMLRAIDHIVAASDTQIMFVSHSAGDLPHCINQFLSFEPDGEGFTVRCTQLAAAPPLAELPSPPRSASTRE